jgi:hypothetical protein
MESQLFRTFGDKRREEGAALVTVLLISLLLFVVCAAIITITGLSRSTTVDAVSERQAYEAASNGMQIVLNTLRGNGSGATISFKDAAVRVTSNKPDDWFVSPRMSKWLNYSYPAAQPDRVPLTSPYDPYNGLAFSVTISPPDLPIPGVVPTPNPTWIDGPVVKPNPPVKPPKPAWHPWDCAHCSWDYTHCSLYNPPNNGTLRSDGTGCRHAHCIPPSNLGEATGEDGYQRLLIRVVGYGPRGARKEMEALVRRTTFFYNPESLMYMQGSDSGAPVVFTLTGTPKVTFDSGNDIAFVVTNASDEVAISSVINQPNKVTIVGKGDQYEVIGLPERPRFLASADEARAMLSELEADAKIRGRWFTSYPLSGNAGTSASPRLTFVRGNATVSNSGAGILVVTGTLTLTSFNDYKGLILLMGNGRLAVTAGDKSMKIEGGVVISKFGATGGFLPPEIDMSGGEYTFKSNPSLVRDMFETLNINVLAVRGN